MTDWRIQAAIYEGNHEKIQAMGWEVEFRECEGKFSYCVIGWSKGKSPEKDTFLVLESPRAKYLESVLSATYQYSFYDYHTELLMISIIKRSISFISEIRNVLDNAFLSMFIEMIHNDSGLSSAKKLVATRVSPSFT